MLLEFDYHQVCPNDCIPCDETDKCNVNFHETECSMVSGQHHPHLLLIYHQHCHCLLQYNVDNWCHYQKYTNYNHYPRQISPSASEFTGCPDEEFCSNICAMTGLSNPITWVVTPTTAISTFKLIITSIILGGKQSFCVPLKSHPKCVKSINITIITLPGPRYTYVIFASH